MAPRYTTIRRAAYEPVADGNGLTADFHTLEFPESLATQVLDLANLGRTGRARLQAPPTRQLDSLLQALDVRLGVLPRPVAAGEGSRTWLYCPADAGEPLRVPILLRLLEFWIEKIGADHPREANQVCQALRAEPPAWKKQRVSLTRCDVSDGGTAHPTALQYLLTTQHFANRLQEHVPYDSGGQVLRFRSVARQSRQQGAELMSQPLFYDNEHGRWWFSVTVAVTLHTVPFRAQPRVHLHFGVRRWATNPDPETGLVRLGYRRDSAVYLRPVTAWLPGAPASERFSVAYVTSRDEGPEWRHGDPAKLMAKVASGRRSFPDPAGLLGEPERWFTGDRGVDALIAYSTPMGKHGVGAGFMSDERSRLVEWAELALLPDLARVPDLTRSSLSANKPANVRRGGSTERTAAAKVELRRARRTSLAALYSDWSGTPEFAARLLWRTETTREQAITALIDVLGLEGDGGASEVSAGAHDRSGRGEPVVLRWETPGLVVTLSCLRLDNGLTDSLGVSREPVRDLADRAAQALAKRRADMGEFLAKNGADAAVPTVALVEIHGRTVFRGRNDPKFALRLGAADSGVVTQFVTTPGTKRAKKALPAAAESSWLDALRQLGATVMPRTDIPAGLPDGIQYLAVWMATKARGATDRSAKGKFPVAVLVRTGASKPDEILAWDAEAVEGMGAWITYPRYLTRLPALAAVAAHDLTGVGDHDEPWLDSSRTRDEQRSATEEFMHQVLSSAEVRGIPTALLVDAQNIRNLWTWVQDAEVRQDLIRTGIAPAGRPNPWLRLVRIRTGERRETPQWWGLAAEDGVNGLPANLWTSTGPEYERIFYSTTPKASTAQTSAVEAHKLQTRPIRRGERAGEPTIDVDRPAWNPGLVEIAVLGCHLDAGDSPAALAMAVHQLRQAPDYRDALSRPLPLHLARKAQEYILPMRDVNADDGDPETVGS
ncbi:pPIWI_RE module domain-containing protein [Amycolatopsis sp. cg5]|uniref:pPIWI_RE module domain-containing protein n=1 Tax=Amycolatopsis sp. cg5 TaxID=3238802 RepID=UPI003526A65E